MVAKYVNLTCTQQSHNLHKHNNHNEPLLPYPQQQCPLTPRLHGNNLRGPRSWCRCFLWVCSRRPATCALLPMVVPLFEVGNEQRQNIVRKWCIGLGRPPFGGSMQPPTKNQSLLRGVCKSGGMTRLEHGGGRHPIVWGMKKKIERWVGPWPKVKVAVQSANSWRTRKIRGWRKGAVGEESVGGC